MDPKNMDPRAVEARKKAKAKGNKHNFSTFYNAIKDAAANEQTSALYGFTESTYTELGQQGILNLEGIDDLSALDDGSAIQAAAFNNGLI